MRRAALGRLQPLNFHLELEAQLLGLLIWQPVRHLRKDGPPVERAAGVPRKAPRSAGLSGRPKESSAQRGPERARSEVRRAPRPGRRDKRPRSVRHPYAQTGLPRTGSVGCSHSASSSSRDSPKVSAPEGGGSCDGSSSVVPDSCTPPAARVTSGPAAFRQVRRRGPSPRRQKSHSAMDSSYRPGP
jgi:hypothetical protein